MVKAIFLLFVTFGTSPASFSSASVLRISVLQSASFAPKCFALYLIYIRTRAKGAVWRAASGYMACRKGLFGLLGSSGIVVQGRCRGGERHFLEVSDAVSWLCVEVFAEKALTLCVAWREPSSFILSN